MVQNSQKASGVKSNLGRPCGEFLGFKDSLYSPVKFKSEEA